MRKSEEILQKIEEDKRCTLKEEDQLQVLKLEKRVMEFEQQEKFRREREEEEEHCRLKHKEAERARSQKLRDWENQQN